MSTPLTPRIHARGEERLDAVLELVAYSARPRPLSLSLDEMPKRLSRIFKADVCSIYLLEGSDLVMRGNVGFKASALGQVRLSVGEGITGLAVEYMRPMSLDAAPSHASYRHFPGLGEERFPLFLAVPVAGPSGPLGALVLQRREPPAFDAADVELASALTAPIAAVAERAKLVDALRGRKKASVGGARRMTLSGRPVVPGRAQGVICALPRPASHVVPGPAQSHEELARAMEKAVAQARRSLEVFHRRAATLPVADRRFLEGVGTILEDARLRERALELCAEGKTLASALNHVSSEATRAAKLSGEAFGVERARAISEVCEALGMLSANEKVDLPRSAVLIGDQLTVFDLLVSARAHPSAVVLSEHGRDPLSHTLLGLLSVPSVVEVAGLSRWAAAGELALVDADHGLVRLNPSRAEISALRSEKKQKPPPAAP